MGLLLTSILTRVLLKRGNSSLELFLSSNYYAISSLSGSCYLHNYNMGVEDVFSQAVNAASYAGILGGAASAFSSINSKHGRKLSPQLMPASDTNSTIMTMRRKKRKRRKSRRLPPTSIRVLKAAKAYVDKPQWSPSYQSRKFQVTNVSNAQNLVSYTDLFDAIVPIVGTKATYSSMIEGGTSLALRKLLDNTGNAVPIDLTSDTDATRIFHTKLTRYRFDLKLRFKNLANVTSYLDVALVKCKKRNGTSNTPIQSIVAAHDTKAGDTDANIYTDHWQDALSLIRKNDEDWTSIKQWKVIMNPGQVSDLAIHVPWEVTNWAALVASAYTASTYLKGQYRVIVRSMGDLTHNNLDATSVGWSQADTAIAYDFYEYTGFKGSNHENTMTQVEPGYTAVLNPVSVVTGDNDIDTVDT